MLNLLRQSAPISWGVLAVVAVVSFLLGQFVFSVPDTYAGINAALAAKETTVVGMMAAATGAAVGIATLPAGGLAVISTALMNISSNLLAVLVVIMVEKYALTIIGFLCFCIVIPACCVLLVIASTGVPINIASKLYSFCVRITVLSVLLLALVPVSVGLSGLIESTYAESFDQVFAAVGVNPDDGAGEKADEQAANSAATPVDPESAGADVAAASDEGFDLFAAIADAQAGIATAVADPGKLFNDTTENITNALEAGGQAAADMLGSISETGEKLVSLFVEALVILIVCNCVIPIGVIVLFYALFKAIMGVALPTPKAMGRGAKRVMGEMPNAPQSIQDGLGSVPKLKSMPKVGIPGFKRHIDDGDE